MRHVITTCDAPGCDKQARDELPATWWRMDCSVSHGPFPTMHDPRTDVLDSRAFFACSPQHITAAFAAAFAHALDAHGASQVRS